MVICESTYGGQVRDSRKSTEQDLCIAAEDAVRRGGKVLIPTGGVGKAQEIAALLCAHWDRHGIEVPILLGRGMIQSGFEVLKSLSSCWSMIDWSKLAHVGTADVQTILTKYESQPVVYLSPPKTLDGGPSLEVLRVWANDPNNLILLPSYSVPGTVAFQILHGQRRLTTPNGPNPIDLKAKMRYFSIASHSDSIGIQTFFRYSAPLLSILVHGEVSGMRCLGTQLREVLRRPVCLPVNNEVIVVQFPGIPITPSAIRELYKCVVQKKEQTTATMRTTLRTLLERNSNNCEIWIAQKRNAQKTNEQQLKDVTFPNMDSIIAEWCPDVSCLLDSFVTVGPDSAVVVAAMHKMLAQEHVWPIEDANIPQLPTSDHSRKRSKEIHESGFEPPRKKSKAQRQKLRHPPPKVAMKGPSRCIEQRTDEKITRTGALEEIEEIEIEEMEEGEI